MSNLTGQPVRQKAPPADPDAAYLATIHDLPCCICEAFGEVQLSPTQAHHPFCGRYSSVRAPDLDAIPICEGHHLGMWDKSKLAIHQNKAARVAKYGNDTDYIDMTRDKISGEWNAP